MWRSFGAILAPKYIVKRPCWLRMMLCWPQMRLCGAYLGPIWGYVGLVWGYVGPMLGLSRAIFGSFRPLSTPKHPPKNFEPKKNFGSQAQSLASTCTRYQRLFNMATPVLHFQRPFGDTHWGHLGASALLCLPHSLLNDSCHILSAALVMPQPAVAHMRLAHLFFQICPPRQRRKNTLICRAPGHEFHPQISRNHWVSSSALTQRGLEFKSSLSRSCNSLSFSSTCTNNPLKTQSHNPAACTMIMIYSTRMRKGTWKLETFTDKEALAALFPSFSSALKQTLQCDRCQTAGWWCSDPQHKVNCPKVQYDWAPLKQSSYKNNSQSCRDRCVDTIQQHSHSLAPQRLQPLQIEESESSHLNHQRIESLTQCGGRVKWVSSMLALRCFPGFLKFLQKKIPHWTVN